MNKLFFKVISLTLVIVMCLSLLAACGSSSLQNPTDGLDTDDGKSSPNGEPFEDTPTEEPVEEAPTDGLSDEQRASLAMMNYLAYAVQEISVSKYSREALEEVYYDLENSVEKSMIDEASLQAFGDIFDTIKQFRMNISARERLEILHEQISGSSILSYIPALSEVVGAVRDRDPINLIVTIADTALAEVGDSTSSPYYVAEEIQYLQSEWALEDSEEEAVLDSRANLFKYMVSIAQVLPQGVTLNKEDFEEFVTHTTDSTGAAKLDWLERNQDKYKQFGYYWLELADSRYENKDYSGCLSAIAEYRQRDAGIFKYDRRLAQSMPKALYAASQSLSGEEYEAAALDFIETIVNNIGANDWELRYSAALAYYDLYTKTNDLAFLEKSYHEAKVNVENLAPKQKEMNRAYINNETGISEDSNDSEEKKSLIDTVNQFLKKKREIELPPVNEALLRNCELLFAVAEELDIPNSEKAVIDSILHDDAVFLTYEQDKKFSFNKTSAIISLSDASISYTGSLSDQKLTLPAIFAPAGTEIRAEVINNGESIKLDEWSVFEVKRNGNNQPDNRSDLEKISDFEAIFTCKSSEKIRFKEGDAVTLWLTPPGDISDEDEVVIRFVVNKSNIFGVQFSRVSDG